MAGRVTAYITSSDEETMRLGFKIGASCVGGENILLYGDLGAGKTTLTKGIACGVLGLSLEEAFQVVSPTFVYLQIYDGKLPLYHFDLYRLRGDEEFYAQGFDEYLKAGGVTCIEWPTRVPELEKMKMKRINIRSIEENVREVSIEW